MKLILFLCILSVNTVLSQSLSLDETISYLNNLSNEHPGKGYFEDDFDALANVGDECQINCYYTLSYNRDKTRLSIQETLERVNCPSTPVKLYTTFNKKLNRIKNGYLYTIDVSDFDSKNIELLLDKKRSRIKINSSIPRYEFYIPENNYSKIGILADSMQITTDNVSYLKVFYNGLKYLIALAQAEIPKEKEEIVDDPFIKRKPQTSTIPKSTENKIPLKVDGGVFSLNVTLGGKVFSKFILDSGAGECSISSELEKKLIESGLIHQSDYLIGGLYKMADGTIVENRRVRISKISIGNKTLPNVILSIGPSDSPNLLGQSFLNRLNSWSIDNTQNILIFK